MIAAACVPVFSASLLTICVPEYVQESGVECVLYVVTAVYGIVWLVGLGDGIQMFSTHL